MSKKTSNKDSPIHELAVEGDDVHGLPQRVQDPDVVPVGESGAAHALQEPRRRRRLRERGAPLLRGQRRRPPRAAALRHDPGYLPLELGLALLQLLYLLHQLRRLHRHLYSSITSPAWSQGDAFLSKNGAFFYQSLGYFFLWSRSTQSLAPFFFLLPASKLIWRTKLCTTCLFLPCLLKKWMNFRQMREKKQQALVSSWNPFRLESSLEIGANNQNNIWNLSQSALPLALAFGFGLFFLLFPQFHLQNMNFFMSWIFGAGMISNRDSFCLLTICLHQSAPIVAVTITNLGKPLIYWHTPWLNSPCLIKWPLNIWH